jgi:type IV secretory pathway ATPase VirB11/archaellum biosynthesis ATPase
MKKSISWGPLEKFILDKNVHEIIVDHSNDSLIEGKAGIKKGPIFKPQELKKLSQDLMSFSSNKNAMTAEVLLPGNILVFVALPPLALNGPFIRIWKKPSESFRLEKLLEWGAMDEKQMVYLKNLIQTDQSFIVAGNAGSGKTTLMNCILNTLPEEFHVVTIEQYSELDINRPRTVRFVAPQNKASEMLDLVEAASRSRGDCLVLNGAKGAEIFPFMELIIEGHQAIMSMSGENIFDVLKRLEYKISANAPWMSIDDIKFSMTKAFGHIVFQERDKSGKRKISQMVKLSFIDGEIQAVQVKL